MMQQPKMPQMHRKASGAGSSIIAILQVSESDMAAELAKLDTLEEDEVGEYEETKQENKITTASKQQDVKFKGKAVASLEKTLADLVSERDTVSTEQSAVLEYDARLKARCLAKPVSYEERKKRREGEIAGLK